MKKLTLLLVVLLMVSLTGCYSQGENRTMKEGIKIIGMVSSLGAVKGEEDNFERQSYRYSVTIQNYDKSDYNIISIQPVLGSDFLKRVENKENKVIVNGTLPSEQSLTIDGEIIFETKGLSKEEIIGMEPFIEKFNILEERVLEVNNNRK